jgi:hypothetical protein
MKGIYLIILYILSFSFQGNAQSIDALKNLDKIVISGPSGGVYFLPKPIRQKASDLSNFVAKEYERLFIKVFEELDIRVVKLMKHLHYFVRLVYIHHYLMKKKLN